MAVGDQAGFRSSRVSGAAALKHKLVANFRLGQQHLESRELYPRRELKHDPEKACPDVIGGGVQRLSEKACPRT